MACPVGVFLVPSHPLQYGAPVCRRFGADPQVEATVAYGSPQGAQPGIDRDIGVEVAWSVRQLSGSLDRPAQPLAWAPPAPVMAGQPGWSLIRRG